MVLRPAMLNRCGRNFAQMGRFPGNFERPRSRAAKIAKKKTNLFTRVITPPKCHFSVADLRAIRRQHVNRRGHQSFQKKLRIFIHKGGTYHLQKTTLRCVSVGVLFPYCYVANRCGSIPVCTSLQDGSFICIYYSNTYDEESCAVCRISV